MGLLLFAVLFLLGVVRHPLKLVALKSIVVALILTVQSIGAPTQSSAILPLASTFAATYLIAILCFGFGRALAVLRPISSEG